MERYYETKIGKIIDKNFDGRMTNAVIGYIIDKGWENVKEITDGQIAKIEGQALMTAEFAKALVKTAREICQTCSMWEDFMPYIRCHIGINGYQTEELAIDKDCVGLDAWTEITSQLDVDDECDRICMYAIVTDEEYFTERED